MDLDSGRIIYANNKDLVRSVASISKIMTAVVAIESDKLTNLIIFSFYGCTMRNLDDTSLISTALRVDVTQRTERIKDLANE